MKVDFEVLVSDSFFENLSGYKAPTPAPVAPVVTPTQNFMTFPLLPMFKMNQLSPEERRKREGMQKLSALQKQLH